MFQRLADFFLETSEQLVGKFFIILSKTFINLSVSNCVMYKYMLRWIVFWNLSPVKHFWLLLGNINLTPILFKYRWHFLLLNSLPKSHTTDLGLTFIELEIIFKLLIEHSALHRSWGTQKPRFVKVSIAENIYWTPSLLSESSFI